MLLHDYVAEKLWNKHEARLEQSLRNVALSATPSPPVRKFTPMIIDSVIRFFCRKSKVQM